MALAGVERCKIRSMKKAILTAAVAVTSSLLLSSVFAERAQASGLPADLPPAKCQKDFQSFDAWKQDFRKEALASGISVQTYELAQSQITFSSAIIAKDQSQGGFYKAFLDFALPRATPRIAPARALLAKHASVFNKIKSETGMAPEILIAFWGMETDFRMGKSANQSPVITSMATLAYDCRRAAAFRMNLLAALHLLEKNEVQIGNMVGEWAGEMSGLQFTPSNYWEFGVDFDGDGHRDPVNSVSDMMGTAANMFVQNGWRRGEPYMTEVKVPANMAWEEADMTVTKIRPMSFWQQQGVTTVSGATLPHSNMQGALMLPMGRLGPAFIAYPNFRALLKWNASSNNALTAAYLASRVISPATPAMSPGRGKVEVMTSPELKELQTLLTAKGYNVGKIDGFIGTGTREAVRAEQLKLGLPADAYPTHELIAKLRR